MQLLVGESALSDNDVGAAVRDTRSNPRRSFLVRAALLAVSPSVQPSVHTQGRHQAPERPGRVTSIRETG